MLTCPSRRQLILAALLTVGIPCSASAQRNEAPTSTNALTRYVAADDDSYAWKVRQEVNIGATTATELIMTSQTWQGKAWKHQLYLLKPSSWDRDTSHALLFIGGGRWRDEYDSKADPNQRLPNEARLLTAVAERLKTPVAVLLQVPNQPLFEDRYEDAIIALTFKKYLETGDDTWPLLLPMAKSAVRAMDATSAYARQEWQAELKTYTVSGASKRGWTTWLTGAVDKRATAIAPMVIDMLNMPVQMKHQLATWGDFSYKIDDYTQLNLPRALQTPAGKKLQQIVDPWAYRKLLSQPKLILLGTNDHYWPLDALNLYWDDLTGPKYILYLPNNRHGLSDYVRLVGTVAALHRSVMSDSPLPDMSWKFAPTNKGMSLSVSSEPAPNKVRIWRATSETRDFRNAKWTSDEQVERNGDSFNFALPKPAAGYEAFFGEAVFGAGEQLFHLSTNVRVVGTEQPKPTNQQGE